MKPAIRPGIFRLAVLILTVIGLALQTCALLFGYDADKGVWLLRHALGPASGWFLAAGVLILLLLAVASVSSEREKTPDCVSPCSTAPAFFAAMSGGLCLAASVFLTVSAFRAIKSATASTLPRLVTIRAVSLVMLILAIPTAAYLVLSAMTRRSDLPLLKALGFFPVLFLAVCLLRIYFDVTSAINDPMKLLLQLSLAALMLAFLAELRSLVGKPGRRFRLASAAAALLLGVASSGSMLALEIRSLASSAPGLLQNEFLLAVTELFLSFYFAGRLLAMTGRDDA